MEPSSLIFLVIIGIWGAYFVQYWVRRREHLATIRSVDAFSQTMRVLQVRAPLPSVDDGGSLPRTYAVSPARAMRPEVTVKRAEAYAVSPATAAASVGSHSVDPEPHHVEADLPSMHPNRATRGIVLLVGLAGTPVFGVLAAVGVLVWWAFVVPMLMAVGGFVWLRAGVQAEARARRAARGRARRAAERVAAPARTAAPRAQAEPSAATTGREVPVEVAGQFTTVESEPAPAPYDVSAEAPAPGDAAEPAPETVAAQPRVAVVELDEDDIPLTWDPRPVPRPTYTMKARAAQRPAPQPEPAAAAALERTAYEDEAPQRRIAGA
ncbi:hypothetical protein ACOCJ4_03455 [Knoellia sp. CPCC 206435]|uniref:hypothetical protein n=1 Tax=Knoellia terrae TaxID=3404797 RepID=UPI003B42D847